MPLGLSFHEYGNGPPLIILHGLFGSAQNWRAIAERLADRWRIFACDLRNHGASPWRPTMSFVEMADDLEALIAAKGLALTGWDLLTDERLRKAAKAEYLEKAAPYKS